MLPSQFQIHGNNGGSGFQNIDGNLAYRFRFRPKSCTVTNLSVGAYLYPGDLNSIPFPGDITVASQGSYGKTTQSISVTMPRLEILSGIFSYVVFSECTLYKDSSGGSPACP
jgi:hypothetical protein